MDSNHMCHLSPGIKWNAYFWITFNFWWLAVMVDGLKPHAPPLSNQKNEMLIFGLHSTSDDQLGWSMDSNPIRHPSPARKMKCLFLDYFQFLVISQAGQWTQTPSTCLLKPKKKWNAHFWITFTFWWSARLVDGLKPHLPPLSRHKIKCSFLHYIQLVMIGRAGQWTQTPSATLPQPKKWNAHFCIMFNFWWSAGLVDGLKPHPLPFSSQNNEMLIFVLHSTSDDWPGWSLDLNPIHLLSQAKKNEMLIFWLLSISGDQPGWSMDSNPIHQPSPAKEWNAHFWIMFNFWWSVGLVNGLKPHLWPLSNQKNEMLVFVLCYTSDDQLGWSMDLNPICHPSQAKKVKCSFLYYI